MTIVSPTLRNQIVQQVQEALDRHQPRAYRIEVDPEAILEDTEWYHVVIKTPNDVRDRDFYDALAQAETELNEASNGHQFLLVPAIVE
jgi:phage baseplate assembly protein W